MQFSLKRRLKTLVCYQCNISSGTLSSRDYFSSGSSGLPQRLTSRHAANESLSHSSKWCDRLSQPFTSVYFIGCGSRPQIFISFYSHAAVSSTKRSGGGRALREKKERVEGSGGGTCNGVECRGRDVWALLLWMPSRSIFLCLKPRLPW